MMYHFKFKNLTQKMDCIFNSSCSSAIVDILKQCKIHFNPRSSNQLNVTVLCYNFMLLKFNWDFLSCKKETEKFKDCKWTIADSLTENIIILTTELV